MRKLEKIVSSTKKHWKEIVTATTLPFIFSNFVKAGGLFLKIISPSETSRLYIKHISGAQEDFDSEDARSPPVVYTDFYSLVNFDPYRLMRDSRPPNSTTTITLEIGGVVGDGLLDPLIWYPNGENNFSWKNIIGELYNSGDVNEPNNLISTYDMKYMDKTDAKIPLTINNSLSYQLLIKFFNHADLNRDRKVDGKDFAIFAQNWGRNEESDPNTFGANVGSEPNDFNAYSDIDRNGIVDFNDLSTFSGEWLWDANDPNTWSRVR